MEFLIKKNATLPLLKLQVVKDGRSDYNSFMKLIEVSSIYFSMTDLETGIPKIMSRPAGFVEKTFDDPNAETEYYLYYQFTSTDTNLDGRFEGQFMLRNSDGVLILPIREKLYINVQESFIANDLNYESCYVSEFPCCIESPIEPICPPCTSPLPLTQTPSVTPSSTPNYCKTFQSDESNIIIFDDSPASVYPINIYIDGIVNAIDSITVTLNNYQHTYVGDVGMVLLSPDGLSYSILTGRKGSVYGVDGTINLSSNSLTLWDGHSSGTFLNDSLAYANLFFNSPCPYQFPQGESTQDLTVFLTTTPGTYANGIWTLYIQDFATEDVGSIDSVSITICDSGIPRTPTPTATPTPTPTITPGFEIKLKLFGLINPGSVNAEYYVVLDRPFFDDITLSFTHTLQTSEGNLTINSDIPIYKEKTSNLIDLNLDFDFYLLNGINEFTNVSIFPPIYNKYFSIEESASINFPTPTPTPTQTPLPICQLVLSSENFLTITTENNQNISLEQYCILLTLEANYYKINNQILVAYLLTSSQPVPDNVTLNFTNNISWQDFFLTIVESMTISSGGTSTDTQQFLTGYTYDNLAPYSLFDYTITPLVTEIYGYDLLINYSFNPVPQPTSFPPFPPTQTPTLPTPTPTNTQTPTNTPTNTTTNTQTPTQTSTNTPTPSVTNTQTPSGTLTPTPSVTVTNTMTQTPTMTPSTTPSYIPFISIWTAASPISLPYSPTGLYSGTIDWGDGNVSANTYANRTHNYAISGDYTITITGQIDGFSFQSFGGGYETSIKEIIQFGSLKGGINGTEGMFYGCSNLILTGVTDVIDLTNVTKMGLMFFGCTGLTFVNLIDSWDTTTVIDMSGMFNGCTNFDGDLSAWNTGSVSDMSNMFNGCSLFDNLGNDSIGGWDVRGVMNMSSMFKNCPIFNRDISTWNTSSLDNTESMFEGCSLFNQDMSGWNTSNVIKMQRMFYSATSLSDGGVGSWDVSNVTDMSEMFYGDSSFNGNITAWNVSSVTNMSNMFNGASVFNQDIGLWDVSNVTDMGYMFNQASLFNNGTSSSISGWTTSDCTNMSSMFRLTQFNQNIDSWDTSSVTGMSQMLQFTPFNQPIGSWDVSNVTDMSYMLENCSNFNQPLSGWNVSNVTNFSNMFGGTNIGFGFPYNISMWNVSAATNMSGMFINCAYFNSPLSGWNVSNVTDMSYMFFDANSFNQPIGNWDVSNVTNMQNMFDGVISFNQPLSAWNVSNVTNMSQMFANASFSLDIGNWDVSSVTNMLQMFSNSSFNNGGSSSISGWTPSACTNMTNMFNNSPFNQPIGSWTITNVSGMTGMLDDSSINTSNYDNILIGWASQAPSIQTGVTLGVSGLTYTISTAQASRDILTGSPYNWIIVGDTGV